MKRFFAVLVACLFVGCGGGSEDSSGADSDLSGRYAGVLRGTSCTSGQEVTIDIQHDVDVSAPESESSVTVVDDDGLVYEGAFSVLVRPEGNVYGFSVRRSDDDSSELPLAFSYNFSGLPKGQANVAGFSGVGLTGECDEFTGTVLKVSGEGIAESSGTVVSQTVFRSCRADRQINGAIICGGVTAIP
jgi:hypothetical protein